MSTSNMPVKGDSKWLKSLNPGTPLYNAEYVSEANEVVLHKVIFDEYDTKSVKKDGSESIYAKVHIEGAKSIDVPTQDISYGYFQTPLEALEKFRDTIEYILKSSEKAIREENKRLEKLIKRGK